MGAFVETFPVEDAYNGEDLLDGVVFVENVDEGVGVGLLAFDVGGLALERLR